MCEHCGGGCVWCLSAGDGKFYSAGQTVLRLDAVIIGSYVCIEGELDLFLTGINDLILTEVRHFFVQSRYTKIISLLYTNYYIS